MRGLGILLLIVLFFWLVWPVVARWLKRKAMERAEDYMRSSMGMPPRDKSKNKKRKNSGDYQGSYYYQKQRRNPFGENAPGKEPIIPKEYAEDVEFVETKDYSHSESDVKKEEPKATYQESQISDAEWTEIKKSNSK